MKKLWVAVACLLAAIPVYAQFGGGGRGGRRGTQDGPEYREKDESGFVYGRLLYHVSPNWRGGEVPWHHDYPLADETFPDSLQRLTTAHSTRESYQIVAIESKELFQYPYVYLAEPGYLDLHEDDVKNLREYLDRGGFLFIDDFRGAEHLRNLEDQMKKVYPDREIVELDGRHPIFHTFYEMESLEMEAPPIYRIPKEETKFLGLADPKGRLQAIIDYNNDLSEYWEWLDQGDKPLEYSAKSIRLGVNYAIYAMTH